MKLSPLHFQLSIFVIKKRLADSASRQVDDSLTRRVDDSPTRPSWEVSEYDNFGLFLRPSIIALYKKSSLYFKSVDFLHWKSIYKKCASDGEFYER